MVAAITEDHAPYTALQTSKLEDPEFLESVVPGLSTFTDEIPAPKLTDELAQALAGFDKGVRYIFKEGEFEYRDDPIATASDSRSEDVDVEMDKDGWGPGVLEKVLWDRRKGSEQRQRWKRRQERTKRRLEGYEVSDTTESSSESSSKTDTSSSTSTSGSSSDSSDSEAVARPTSINKAIGRDNVGFQLLSKLGWQQGTGLGASSEGIVEPIRVPTRFSTVRASARGRFNRRGRGKGKRVERPSLGTGRHKEPIEQQQQPGDAADKVDDDTFASYRKQMSSAYRQTTNQQPGSPEN
ncbi:hypothetical protein IWW50_003011 [Coemansia erecta]|nr:hypothetical protein GGF43_002278 [Coemansia sp. RSA 2618]KAJ2825094.1 hypothetical protein IWW50_003011 [Coemansia erecta]